MSSKQSVPKSIIRHLLWAGGLQSATLIAYHSGALTTTCGSTSVELPPVAVGYSCTHVLGYVLDTSRGAEPHGATAGRVGERGPIAVPHSHAHAAQAIDREHEYECRVNAQPRWATHALILLMVLMGRGPHQCRSGRSAHQLLRGRGFHNQISAEER